MNLTVHNVYFCFSEVGCTISLRDGTPCKEVPAHTPTLFVAQQSDMVCSDPAAVVKEIPNGLQLLHGQMMKEQTAGGVPAWFKALKTELTALLDGSKFELAWLASKKTLVVHTDRVDDDLLERVRATAEAYLPAGVELVQYNHHIDISWRDINKYAECRTVDDMLAVNPDYQNDLTSDGQWLYPLPEMTKAPSMTQSTARVFVCNLPKVRSMYASYQGCGFEIVEYNVPKVGEIDSVFRRMPNLHTVNGDFSKIVNALNAMANNPKLTSFNSALTKLSYGNGIFYDCRLDKSSALRVLNSIPTYTSGNHPLTIGIHVDHKTDEEVLAAIANAESGGWTLTVQWNGTPTAQASVTYGLRKPPIYAKVGEMERPDGTVERTLDWGHYVTDETGYETFRSVEEAEEHFNIKPTE